LSLRVKGKVEGEDEAESFERNKFSCYAYLGENDFKSRRKLQSSQKKKYS
jgi:hypothetical protein